MSPLPLPRVPSLGSQCRQRPSLSGLDSMVSWDSGQTVRKILHRTSPDPCVPVCLRAHATRRRRAENEQNPGPFPLFSVLLGTPRLALLSLTYSREHGASNIKVWAWRTGRLKATSVNRTDFSGAQPNAGMPLRLEATELARKAAPRQGVQPSSQHRCTWHTVGTQI